MLNSIKEGGEKLMKRTLFLVVVMLLMAGLAFAGISTSKHNLASSSTASIKSNTVDEICVFCHTPHGAGTAMTDAPLWNRNSPSVTWTAYTSTTMNATATTGSAISQACLGCHDGNLGNDSMYNGPGSGNANATVGYAAATFASIANLNDGVSLKNDHPIGVNMGAGQDDPDIYTSPTNTKIRLFGSAKNTVECPSCHFVHDNTIPPFLAMNNAKSAMCLACHNK